MAIGSLGDISFEVSSEKIRTFDELQRNASARLALHNRQGGKELIEFVGPSVETITFSMRLSAYERLNPTEEVKALRKLRDAGEAVLFILDGMPQGDGYWIIESLSEEYDYVDNKGRPYVINCSLTLKEYLPTRE
jgi:phage protein U